MFCVIYVADGFWIYTHCEVWRVWVCEKCLGLYSREELVTILLSKWGGLSKMDIFLSYDLLGAWELDLADEEDMVTMLRLLDEGQSRRVHIYVRCISGIPGNELYVSRVMRARGDGG